MPRNPQTSPKSVPCPSWTTASEPFTSKSTTARAGVAPSDMRTISAMRAEAAVCELDGPRITGPITSLKMLAGVLFIVFSPAFGLFAALRLRRRGLYVFQEFFRGARKHLIFLPCEHKARSHPRLQRPET